MKIRELCRFDVSTVAPEATLFEAALRMETMEFSSLPVVRDGRLLGIVTERDIVRSVAEGADVRTTTVEDYMSPDPFTTGMDEDSSVVAERMVNRGVRHLPVMEGGRIVGIVSARDLLIPEAWTSSPTPTK